MDVELVCKGQESDKGDKEMGRFSVFMNDVRESSRLIRTQLFSDAALLVWNVI